MAIETRAVQFFRDQETPGAIVSQTLDVPLVRTYNGIITTQNGPSVLIRGEWTVTESVTLSFAQVSTLPTADAVVGAWSDSGNDFSGVCIES